MSSVSNTLAQHVAAELRAQKARRRLSDVEIARRLGVGETWVGRRMTGRVPITLDDLDELCEVLEILPIELMPDAVRAA